MIRGVVRSPLRNCLAPQRETAQAILALMDSGVPERSAEIQRAGKWLWQWLARGQTPFEAVVAAKAFITSAIEHSLELGSGHGPVNPMFGLPDILEPTGHTGREERGGRDS